MKVDVNSLRSRVTDFQYFCQGEDQSSKLQLTKGKVNKQVGEVCTSSATRQVRIAFRQDPDSILVDMDTNTIVGSHGRDGEILTSFLLSHNLIPTWIDADHKESGVYDLVSGIEF